MEIWIGTSGYSYADWVGDFYPAGLRSNQMLAYYSRHFPVVELNFTFYRPPTPEMLLVQAQQTHPEFQFLVKLPQTLSHEQSPRDLNNFRQAVLALRQRRQLLGLLCQLPQSYHDSRSHRAWLETLADALGDLRLAVEFRHRSWATPRLASWLGKRDLDLVSVDAPAIAALFPSGLVQSTGRVYVRLHSRRADTWYAGGARRYDYDYSDQELGEWIGALAGVDAVDQALFLFNNCYGGQAVRNAQRMRTLFPELAPELSLVPPPATPAPVQGTLFE
jgi:uncharacterized protein YecE (DUF72 family)